jgi:hypothetical protein
MNLATAYPPEAAIIHWARRLTLDRTANRIHLNEDFQLHKKVPVQLSLMTPCVPAKDAEGKLVFTPANTSARSVSLGYDATLIVPTIEKIDLTDDWLVGRWGKTIYRVLLTSASPTDSGNWRLEFA